MKRAAALVATGLLAWAAPASARPADPSASFDAFWTLYARDYALFEVKRADWRLVRDVYRPRARDAASREALFEVFAEALGLLNDVHVTVRDDRTGRLWRSGGRGIGSRADAASGYSPEAAAGRLDGAPTCRAGGSICFGRLKDGGVGYLRIAAFRHAASSADAADEAVAAFADAPAVIVDVRSNGGGRDRIAEALAGRFARRRALYMTVQARIADPDAVRFAPPAERFVSPTPDAYRGPVFVLTDARTVSAAENFVLAMRAGADATVVGDVTAGAMADVATRTIEGGWTFTIPVNVMRDPDGVSWEGVGLAPDLWARSEPADRRAGRDPVLDLTVALADARRAGERRPQASSSMSQYR